MCGSPSTLTSPLSSSFTSRTSCRTSSTSLRFVARTCALRLKGCGLSWRDLPQRTSLQKMHCKTSTNILQYGECSLRHWKHLYLWERITQKTYIPSQIQGTISLWNRCLTYLKFWLSENQMRFLEWLQLTGKILHGNNYLWSMMKKSSVSRMQRFTYFQILCYVLEK